MKQDKHKTTVIFRKWKDTKEIIALFPDEKESIPERELIGSYMHIGQHGGAHPDLITELQEAEPNEYNDLKIELESIGYNLEIH